MGAPIITYTLKSIVYVHSWFWAKLLERKDQTRKMIKLVKCSLFKTEAI